MDAKSEIRNVFAEAVDSLTNDYKGSSLTDIFVLVDEESGELSVYDDEENNVARGIIQSWEDPEGNKNIHYASALREVVMKMDDEGCFSSLDVYTPFSINLADEDFIVKEELLLIEDDSVIRIENDFMDRMDREFDEFLDKLLNE